MHHLIMEKMSKDFIYSSQIDVEICDGLIDFFEEHPSGNLQWESKKFGTFYGVKSEGKTKANKELCLDHRMKRSTDLSVPHFLEDERIERYNNALNKVLDEYEIKFPWVSKGCQPWGNSAWDFFNIQKYEPGEGFYRWHSERTTMSRSTVTRYLVFMTYLNDVQDGGGTEWLHQNYQTKAVKGSTVIWPPDWTYTHRGIVSPTETKYIATGWCHFLPPDPTEFVKPTSIQDEKGYFYSSDTFLSFGKPPKEEPD